MQINTPTIMMISFIVMLAASIWKIYAFLPNKALKDDDTTKSSHKELESLILSVIKENKGALSPQELCTKVQQHTNFDKEHFWRFNQNKLNQLLNQYYFKNTEINNIEDIYLSLKKSL